MIHSLLMCLVAFIDGATSVATGCGELHDQADAFTEYAGYRQKKWLTLNE